MRTWWAAAAAVAVAVGGVVPLTASAAQPSGPPDACERTSWRAGTVELCAGALVYRDYVMDDYGAAGPFPTSRKEQLGSLSATAGDQRYPDPAKAGTADLVDLSVRLVGDRLVAVFRLNALYDPASTLAALAIDSDADATTGGGAWPGVQGVRSAGWESVHSAATGDVDANTITGWHQRCAAVTGDGFGQDLDSAAARLGADRCIAGYRSAMSA
jgi:hypothetical protein